MFQFFTPFKLIKKVLPQGLFGRFFIIVSVPVILVQFITTYIFIDRHLDKVTELLADNIARKLSASVDMIMSASDLETKFPSIQNYIRRRYNLMLMLPLSQREISHAPQNLPYKEKLFSEALKSHLTYPFKIKVEDEDIIVKVDTLKGSFIFKERLKHLYPKTTTILLWWAIVTPVCFLLISIIFLRNQIRPLRRLSEVVDDFGRGREVACLKPSGSFEVRKVTRAFNMMRERIKRQMTQRTEMLAGVSHDLRTPLTRMELQLAMMKPSVEIVHLHEDVREMSHMIEEFLAFARGEEGEDMKEHNLSELLRTVAMKHDLSRITLNLPDTSALLSYRQNAITRSLSNIISNAMKYAKNLRISLTYHENFYEICFDDDGPGIPESHREDVFRAFFRLEASRNSETGGVGLGLAITRDIIHSHGGTIHLENSPLGGLRVIIRLPT
ncbi:MAG: HAMP domain-containing protein [Caedimonas sp.]|nr:HAMP domain-containing protein [Caedimonas sp.]